MSHYTVIVTNTSKDNLDEQLAPFSENLEVEPYKNDDGEMTTYNPNSKWDWYQVGGRWTGFFKKKKGAKGKVMQIPESLIGFYQPAKRGYADVIKVKDVDWDNTESPYAILHEGNWFAVGEMGWFGVSNDSMTQEEYEKKYKEIISSLPDDCELTAVDCHI